MITTITDSINPHLKEMGEDVMGFLNEIQLKYPDAITFASGRPDEQFFNMTDLQHWYDTYVDHRVAREGKNRQAVLNHLGQYNRAKGIINEHVAKFLETDERIFVQADDIVMTVGAQEAMALTILSLCNRETDVIVAEDPSYIGFSHFALLAGYDVQAVPAGASGYFAQQLEKKILRIQESGKQVKLVYAIPDHQNPTGNSMSLEDRHQLLQLADRYDFFIIEDNAYGEFVYESKGLPPIKALDSNKKVIYLRSFSKTLFPSMRLAAAVTDATITIEQEEVTVADLMAKVKGYITVNTSSLNQAMLGGLLIKNDHSLVQFNQPKVAAMKQKRDAIVQALAETLDPVTHPWANGIQWTVPAGGFFMRIQLPFAVNKQEVVTCAEQFGVIVTPMSFFYLQQGGENEIRLAFSNVTAAQIKEGINRLANYIKSKIEK
jgi:(S)-3,5-dihydroxyphenylglycine transaminase